MFRQAKQSRVYQDVVEQIQEAIVTGKLKTGDQLPAERDLKERFQVSRGTLREALRVLEQKGLIEIRTGVAGGSIVKGVGTEQVSASLALLIRYKKVSLQNLAEFRIGLEGDVAALAATRATAEDVAKLKALLAKASDFFQKGPDFWDSFIRTDEEIHLGVAETTRNPLFISVLESLSQNIHTYYESFLPRDEALLQENHQDMIQLIAAIEAGNAEEARRVAREHVSRFNSYMEQKGVS
ncbi:FCD domain-containing protein [Geomonas sp. RF6]|uniref:FadR/GntR family transcriptional regulator n=1 Tax=Geomonas sp. RF6 TaxID=2897342 RepID=UPI001E3A29D2|nr:FCD domain-containing protein [Geomonas sp. RF6]UFS70125.1 FCD domain-containing protein [Geomonas sp. RF6]